MTVVPFSIACLILGLYGLAGVFFFRKIRGFKARRLRQEMMCFTNLKDLHCFPSVCAEEQMDHVVFLLALAAKIAVDHLSNWSGPICAFISPDPHN